MLFTNFFLMINCEKLEDGGVLILFFLHLLVMMEELFISFLGTWNIVCIGMAI